MEDNQFSQIVEFITNYQEGKDNNCSGDVFKEIKSLFKQFIIQNRDIDETISHQKFQIEKLEKENTTLEKMAKDIMNTRSPTKNRPDDLDDRDFSMMDSQRDLLDLNRQLEEEKQDMALEYEKTISQLNEQVFMLEQGNANSNNGEMEVAHLKDLNQAQQMEIKDL